MAIGLVFAGVTQLIKLDSFDNFFFWRSDVAYTICFLRKLVYYSSDMDNRILSLGNWFSAGVIWLIEIY